MIRLIAELEASPQVLRAQYDSVFGLVVPKECPPYETEYYPTQETFGRSQQMADVAGFYKAFGIGPAQSSSAVLRPIGPEAIKEPEAQSGCAAFPLHP